VTEAQTPVFGINIEYDNFYLFADLGKFRRMFDLFRPGKVGNMDQAIDAFFEFDKNTEVGKIGGMLSISLHESSSIFHEMVLGNINFNIDPSARYNVRRLGADRLHYILHIYIRTKIEHEIFVNNLTARQIPDLWNSLMKEYIGLVPQDEWEGFMQDVHWASGAFGYFHSYAIGMLNAVDMMQSPRVIEKLKYVDDSDYKKIIEDIILPEIENRYGRFNEFSKDTFEQMYFGCMNSLVDRFENFVEEKFNVV
jgi:Zn-dependent M32 family carboxypeptidase